MSNSGIQQSTIIPSGGRHGHSIPVNPKTAAHCDSSRLTLSLIHTMAQSGSSDPLSTRLARSAILLGVLLASVCARAQTATQTLQANILAEGGLFTIPSVTLTKTGTIFNSYTGSLTGLQYRARTTSTGGGNITVKATTDFPCASGGPCIATPPTPGDALTYICSGATLGSNCSGTQTVSTTTSTSVVSGIPASACTGGGGSCSAADPNTVNLNFILTNDPKYKTGSYSATLTFTISAT